ncbi:hypothetical protein [Qipengyuania sp. ASV99]|uniref:hypothetical protein n=1 Tax=Qipengyuania sp. ASV99 TaxID=3399681 RepID=UPI003A4C7DB2
MTKLCPVLITASPQLAQLAEQSGVGRVMVDLERNGKFERQKFRDTWISKHTFEDIAPVAAALSNADLMVRINPLFDGSREEIDIAIAQGARSIMLPMFRGLDEIERVGALIARRCRFIPLVETAEAFEILGQVAGCDAVDETFVGLNDLHISLGLDFMFEPLTNGMLERGCECLREIGKPFGFGGIARVGEGDLPAEYIIREHARLGSTRVNLSRTFARPGIAPGDTTTGNAETMQREIRKLFDLYDAAHRATSAQRAANTAELGNRVDAIVDKIRTAREHAV